MINTSELMLGNLLYLTLPENNGEERKVVVKVDAILPEDIRFELTCHRRSASPEELSGIPLTREILYHLGMVQYGPDATLSLPILNVIEIEHSGIFYQMRSGEEGTMDLISQIHSVHQLQNLLTANGLPETAKEVGEKVMELLTVKQ